MKYKAIIFLASGILSTAAAAGGSQGGGTPPAKEKLEELMVLDIEYSKLDGGLFSTEIGDIGLLSRVKLQPQMLAGSGISGGTPPAIIRMTGGSSIGTPPSLVSGSVGGSNPPSLTISEDDIAVLRDRNKPIDAIGNAGQNLSFDVEACDSLDSVILKDRRLKMRESIKGN